MRASCYGPGTRGLSVNVRVNAHRCRHTPAARYVARARARGPTRPSGRVRDGYGDISSHVQSHNVTRNTRAHQSFSRKWNLLPSSRRISAPCTRYFARPRARAAIVGGLVPEDSRARARARLTRSPTRLRGGDATNLPWRDRISKSATKIRKICRRVGYSLDEWPTCPTCDHWY